MHKHITVKTPKVTGKLIVMPGYNKDRLVLTTDPEVKGCEFLRTEEVTFGAKFEIHRQENRGIFSPTKRTHLPLKKGDPKFNYFLQCSETFGDGGRIKYATMNHVFNAILPQVEPIFEDVEFRRDGLIDTLKEKLPRIEKEITDMEAKLDRFKGYKTTIDKYLKNKKTPAAEIEAVLNNIRYY